MKVTHAQFVKSAMSPDQYPKDRRPEVAFVGRSNVGKSSLLNALLGAKGLAKTSSTPGKTQTINFFDVNQKIYLVDLPGYGFAKVAKATKQRWNRVMFEYLKNREHLRLVVALLDARHEPSERDQHMLRLLEEAEVPTLLVATKADKLKQSERHKNIAAIRKVLGLDSGAEVLPCSAVTGEGMRELWAILDDAL